LALQLRLTLGSKRVVDMKKAARKPKEKMLMKSPNFVVIMAILTEMARHLSENISKVELKPLQTFGGAARADPQKP
jgi:Ethanolamine utilization protein EutJ (predicted chaperonin)